MPQGLPLFRSLDRTPQVHPPRSALSGSGADRLAQIDPGDGSAPLSCIIGDISLGGAKRTLGTQAVPEEFSPFGSAGWCAARRAIRSRRPEQALLSPSNLHAGAIAKSRK
jgi:hypothetical protein